MKITIFGANGQIGQLLVKQALEAAVKEQWIHKMPIVFNN